jgi:hypothetical protein
MIRMAISPRLAMRTFPSNLFLAECNDDYCAVNCGNRRYYSHAMSIRKEKLSAAAPFITEKQLVFSDIDISRRPFCQHFSGRTAKESPRDD